jgi:hypothetical protein
MEAGGQGRGQSHLLELLERLEVVVLEVPVAVHGALDAVWVEAAALLDGRIGRGNGAGEEATSKTVVGREMDRPVSDVTQEAAQGARNPEGMANRTDCRPWR